VITVKLFGKFGDLAEGKAELLIPAQGMERVEDIYRQLAVDMPALHREITSPQVLVALNQQVVSLDTLLSDGDEVAILPPVTGG